MLWPTMSGWTRPGMGGTPNRWATIAQVGPDCRIVAGTARHMILNHSAEIVLPVGDSVWLLNPGYSLYRRTWQATPPPLRPFADWLGSRTTPRR